MFSKTHFVKTIKKIEKRFAGDAVYPLDHLVRPCQIYADRLVRWSWVVLHFNLEIEIETKTETKLTWRRQGLDADVVSFFISMSMAMDSSPLQPRNRN